MSLNKIKIAIVEDEKNQREIMEMIFVSEGCHNVTSYPSGEEFLKVYQEFPPAAPDIVILDINMSGMSGFDVLREALKNGAFSQTLFVAISAHMTANDSRWLKDIGFEHIILKPYRVEELLNGIKSLLEVRDVVVSRRDLHQREMSAAVQELSNLRLRSSVLENNYIKKLISPKVFHILDSSPDSLIPQDRTVAVGFADIRDFTQLMNSLQIQQVSEVLKLFFEQAIESVTKENGHLDKFIGDEVMWFHESLSVEESCNQCIKAAARIIKGISKLNKAIQKRLHLKLGIQVGIGVACGTAAVGIFGAPKYRIQYTVLGPPVNLAARLCSEARAGEVLIGGEAIEHCLFKSKKIGFRTIKGFDHEVELRSVVIPKRLSLG